MFVEGFGLTIGVLLACAQWRSVMRDWSARSGRPLERAIAGILAVVVVVFDGSVRAEDAPRVGLKIPLTAELRKQHRVAEDVKSAVTPRLQVYHHDKATRRLDLQSPVTLALVATTFLDPNAAAIWVLSLCWPYTGQDACASSLCQPPPWTM